MWSRVYLILFLRQAPPSVEACTSAVDQLSLTTITEALGFTEKAYGARWGSVRISDCLEEPKAGEVRVQASLNLDDCSSEIGVLNHPGSTRWAVDVNGYVTTSVVTVCSDKAIVKVLAHELSHAQGIGHVCDDDYGDKVPHCVGPPHLDPFADEWDTDPAPYLGFEGHLMFPFTGGMGLDTHSMKWAVRRIYGDRE